MSKRGRPKHPDILTPREWEVLGHIREGLSNEEIASRLGISIDGVKFHVSEILGKLALENRHEAARWRPEEARPWWLAAGAPLLFWRRLSFGWLSPALAGGLAVAVAAGIGLLVWALLATRGGGPPTPPVPLALPEGDRVAYVGTDDNLWLLEGGGPARRLTDTGAVQSLRWSPDGRYVVFVNDDAKPADPPRAGWEPRFSLWLADAASRSVRRLADGPVSIPEHPWSPDGRLIAYFAPASEGDGRSVWVTDTAGEAREVVRADVGPWGVALAWSPDGERLALGRNLPPDYPEDWSQPGAHVEIPPESGLYVVDAGGGVPRPVALVEAIQRAWDESEGRRFSSIGATGVDRAQWSPDGRFIAFQPTTLSASLMADGVPLFTVSAEGGAPTYHGFMVRSWALLDWFPGGRRFIFTLGGGRQMHIGKLLALAEAGVPGAQVIAEDPNRMPTPENLAGGPYDLSIRSDAWPAVSPDGTRIAFQVSETRLDSIRLDVGKAEGPREGIWVVDADGSNLRQLTSDPHYLDFLPRWSADGELIMFVRTDGQPFAGDFEGEGSPRSELWAMRSDGSEAKPLLTDLLRTGSYYGLFHWEAYVAWYRAPGDS